MKNIKSYTLLFLLYVGQFAFGQQELSAGNVNPNIQSKLDEILANESTDAIDREVVSLKKSVEMTNAQLIPQVLHYQLATKNSDQKIWRSVYLLKALLNESQAEDLINAILPYLGTEDNATRRRFYKTLDEIFYDQDQYVFTPVEPVLKKQKEKIPSGLVDYLYDRAPGKAFRSFANALAESEQEKERLLLSSRSISDLLAERPTRYQRAKAIDKKTIQKLENLSKENKWWVQLFVAESASQCRSFRKDTIIKKLNDGKHPAIKKRMIRCMQTSGQGVSISPKTEVTK